MLSVGVFIAIRVECELLYARRERFHFENQAQFCLRAVRQKRGWRDLNFVQTIGDDCAKDLGVPMPDGSEYPALIVFRRDGDKVRLFWASEMTREMADPGQPGSARRSRYRLALVRTRLDPGWTRYRLVSETQLLMGNQAPARSIAAIACRPRQHPALHLGADRPGERRLARRLGIDPQAVLAGRVDVV